MTAIPGAVGPVLTAERLETGAACFQQFCDGRCAVVAVAGAVDVAGSATLRQVLAEVPMKRLVVDLSQVTGMDSMAVGVLVAAWLRAASIGGAVRIVRPHGTPLKVFQDTGVDQILPIFDDVDTALRLDRAAFDGVWEQVR